MQEGVGVSDEQPEVYETEDVEFEDNIIELKEIENDGVEHGTLSPSDAFAKFAQDEFSNALSPKNFQAQYIKEEQKESPKDRLKRLQKEVQELTEQVEAASSTSSELQTENIFTDVPLAALAELKEQIQNLALTSKFQNLTDMPRPPHDTLTKLSLQINAIQSAASKEPKEGAQDESRVTYELYGSAKGLDQGEAQIISDLEQRVARMEAAVGSTAADKKGQAPLVDRVERFEQRMAVLDPAHLRVLDSQLKQLIQSMNEVIVQNEKERGDDELKKVDSMLEMLQRFDSTAKQIPHVISRLQALQSVHKQTLSFTESIALIQSQQAEITELLKTDISALTTMESTFTKNMATITKNIQTVEAKYSPAKKENS